MQLAVVYDWHTSHVVCGPIKIAQIETVNMASMRTTALQISVVSSVMVLALGGGAALDPYPFLNNGSFKGREIELSPDPLVRFTWDLPKLGNQRFAYQSYYDSPVNASGSPAQAFTGADLCLIIQRL